MALGVLKRIRARDPSQESKSPGVDWFKATPLGLLNSCSHPDASNTTEGARDHSLDLARGQSRPLPTDLPDCHPPRNPPYRPNLPISAVARPLMTPEYGGQDGPDTSASCGGTARGRIVHRRPGLRIGRLLRVSRRQTCPRIRTARLRFGLSRRCVARRTRRARPARFPGRSRRRLSSRGRWLPSRVRRQRQLPPRIPPRVRSRLFRGLQSIRTPRRAGGCRTAAGCLSERASRRSVSTRRRPCRVDRRCGTAIAMVSRRAATTPTTVTGSIRPARNGIAKATTTTTDGTARAMSTSRSTGRRSNRDIAKATDDGRKTVASHPFVRADRRANGQMRRLPRGDAASELRDVAESVALQQTRRDRRSITARAVDEQRAISRQLAEPLAKMIERDADAPRDRLVLAFAGARTSTISVPPAASRSAASAALMRSVVAVRSGRDSRLRIPSAR